MRYLTAICTALLVQGCASQDEGVVACRADLIENLKAPSTLQIVEAYRGEMQPITNADHLTKMRNSVAQDEARFDELTIADRGVLAFTKEVIAGEHQDYLEVLPRFDSYAILLTYDAENSYGAPRRSHFWCRISVGEDSQVSVFDKNTVTVNEARDMATMMDAIAL